MVMLSNNRRKELNKVLSEWIGLELEREGIFCRKDDVGKKDRQCFYLDFVNSLSNCYEWLVPKMRSCSLIYSKETGYVAQIILDNGSRGEYSSDSPSTSLCVALESLIVAK